MTLHDFVMNQTPLLPWQDGDKIPWNEPAFSERMLQNHLSQDNDWASRRGQIIDRHVACIDRLLPRQARILDLGCGPGLYTHRLARLGHHCVGVDFSPASVTYARHQAQQDGLSIEYALADVRQYVPQGRFDLVMMLFSELNVFRETDAQALLAGAVDALGENGILLIEVSAFDAVHQQGGQPPVWQALSAGLFSDKPHLYLQEHGWDDDAATASTRYSIIDAETGNVTRYGASMKAYTETQYQQLLSAVGLQTIQMISAEDWPAGEPFAGDFLVWSCRR